MREFLFRGKRKDNGEWIESKSVFFSDDGKCEMLYGYTNYRIAYEVIPETVGEYTGLTDKNGKKIFEGDILKGEAEEAIGSVEWQQAECRYLVNVRSGYDWLFMDDDKWCVIGNIHDNPELLQEGKK